MLKFSTEELMLLKSGARGLLRVPWTARRSSQSILKETNPDYSLEGLMLKLEYFCNLTQRANSLEKTLMMTWKGPSSQGYGFSSGHVWMLELDYKESWAPMNWCFWTVVLEKPLNSPLGSKEIQPVHPKRDQSWVFIGRTVEAEAPILWPPDAKSWLIWKDPDAGKDWRWEKGMRMVGWHHRLKGHEFE